MQRGSRLEANSFSVQQQQQQQHRKNRGDRAEGDKPKIQFGSFVQAASEAFYPP